MKTTDSFALLAGFALATGLVAPPAVRAPARRSSALAAAHRQQAKGRASSRAQSPVPNAPTALADEREQAIATLETAGVGVVIERYDVEETDDADDASVPEMSVSFDTDDLPDELGGFDKESTVEALGNLLLALANVVSIDLSDTNVRDEHLAVLRRAATLRKLSLPGTPITDKGLASLATLSDLTVLNLDGNEQITDVGLAHLDRLTKMRTLTLSDTGITDAGLVHLRGMKKLGELALDNTRVTDNGLANLAMLSDLTLLVLDGNKQITDGGLAHLASLTNMLTLTLNDTGITDAGLVHLRRMEQLRQLQLDGTKIAGAGLQHLRGMQALQELRLAHTDLSDAGLAHLRDSPVQVLWLDGTIVSDAGLVHLKEGMAKLYQVTLFDTNVTKAGIIRLRELPQLQGIKRRDGSTLGGVFGGSTFASNPAHVEPATAEQVSRLKDVLRWLPADSESLCVAHGPLADFFRVRDWTLDPQSAQTVFQHKIRPSMNLLDAELRALDAASVALVVQAARPGAGWHRVVIVVFDRPLDEAFMASMAARATKIEQIGDTKVARSDAQLGQMQWNLFIAQPAPPVLVFAYNHDFFADVLARIAKEGDQRAFGDHLPEWKHLDLRARQWAMRHYTNLNSPFVGFVYSLQAGDVARVLYVARDENALEDAESSWDYVDVEVREVERNLIEVRRPVAEKQALGDFLYTLFCLMGEE